MLFSHCLAIVILCTWCINLPIQLERSPQARESSGRQQNPKWSQTLTKSFRIRKSSLPSKPNLSTTRKLINSRSTITPSLQSFSTMDTLHIPRGKGMVLQLSRNLKVITQREHAHERLYTLFSNKITRHQAIHSKNASFTANPLLNSLFLLSVWSFTVHLFRD